MKLNKSTRNVECKFKDRPALKPSLILMNFDISVIILEIDDITSHEFV